ncbi:hypothetical protein LUX34_04450 [Streptomyces werraensis]|nr:hypothetical protein [Streptomyces werraensis]
MNVSSGLVPSNGTAAAGAVAGPAAPSRPPVVDACSLVYDDAAWRVYLNRLGENAPEYLDVFSASFCRYFDAPHSAYRDALAVCWQDAVDVLLPPGRPLRPGRASRGPATAGRDGRVRHGLGGAAAGRPDRQRVAAGDRPRRTRPDPCLGRDLPA